VSLDFADGRCAIDMPRRRIRSFEELRRLIADLQTPLGYTPRDIALYQLKMFEFMTRAAGGAAAVHSKTALRTREASKKCRGTST
jgi:hypothetical protein